MEISYSEAFLIVWASVMTILYVTKCNDMEGFRQFTVHKLKRVASGDAKVVENEIGEPLYTHPVKELTLSIGEIHAVWAASNYYELDKDGQVDVIKFTEFAYAILRKAHGDRVEIIEKRS